MQSKYLLMVSSDKWNKVQRERAEFLFEKFPEIRTVHSLTHSLLMISAQCCTKEQGKEMLIKWYVKSGKCGNAAFNDITAAM